MVEELRSAEPGNGAPEERSGAAPSARGGSGPRRSRGGVGKRFQGKPKVCLFCVEKGQRIDYKQADLLRRFGGPPAVRLLTYDDDRPAAALVDNIAIELGELVRHPASDAGSVDRGVLDGVSARSLAGRLAGVFDRVAASR